MGAKAKNHKTQARKNNQTLMALATNQLEAEQSEWNGVSGME